MIGPKELVFEICFVVYLKQFSNTKGAIYGANSLMYIASSWQGY